MNQAASSLCACVWVSIWSAASPGFHHPQTALMAAFRLTTAHMYSNADVQFRTGRVDEKWKCLQSTFYIKLPGNNSTPCMSRCKWVYKQCSGVNESVYKACQSYVWKCHTSDMLAAAETTNDELDIGNAALTEKTDTLLLNGMWCIRCRWMTWLSNDDDEQKCIEKFSDYLPILTIKGFFTTNICPCVQYDSCR